MLIVYKYILYIKPNNKNQVYEKNAGSTQPKFKIKVINNSSIVENLMNWKNYSQQKITQRGVRRRKAKQIIFNKCN